MSRQDPRLCCEVRLQRPVSANMRAAQQNAVVATSVINAADDSMLTQKGVHVVITDQAAGLRPETPPSSWDDLVSMTQKATKAPDR